MIIGQRFRLKFSNARPNAGAKESDSSKLISGIFFLISDILVQTLASQTSVFIFAETGFDCRAAGNNTGITKNVWIFHLAKQINQLKTK